MAPVRDRIFRAALRAFAEHGYAEVSVDELVSRARTTKPMLYYYFGNKAGLYKAVAEECFALLRAGHREAADESLPARERLRAYVRSEFQIMGEHPQLARFIYRAAYSPPREAPAIDYWQLFMPSFQLVMQIVEAGQREGLIGAGAPPRLAMPLFGLLGIWSQVHMAGPLGGLLDDTQADDVVRVYLSGVGRG
jgi:AcrR family transcriptional regulator